MRSGRGEEDVTWTPATPTMTAARLHVCHPPAMAYSYRYAYLHGFASSPLSVKAQQLRRMFSGFGLELHVPDLNTPSFAALSPEAILRELEQRMGDPSDAKWRLIGSSFGGLLASEFARRHPERVESLALLAPAFDLPARWRESLGQAELDTWRDEGERPFVSAEGRDVRVHWALFEECEAISSRPDFGCPALILHGERDEVVPIATSREIAAERKDVQLIALPSDHRMHDQAERIVAEVQRFFALGRATLK